MKWIEVIADGDYPLSSMVSRREKNSVYYSGTPVNGSFSLGVYDDQGAFVPFNNGQNDYGVYLEHGIGVIVILRVTGHDASSVRVGFTGM